MIGCAIDEGGVAEIARRARGTARVANRLLHRVRDYAEVMADGVITAPVAHQALAQMQIDELGLDQMDRELLRAVVLRFGGGPVGLETIAAAISEEPDTIMDVYEPYLLKLGFLARTPRGRVAMRAAYEHLGLPWQPPAAGSVAATMAAQASLFAAGEDGDLENDGPPERGPARPA